MENQITIDLSSFSKELKLLLKIMKSKSTVSIDPVELSGIDWKLFLQLAQHHRIYPVIYKRLKAMSEEVIPQYVIQSLNKWYQRNTFQMLHLSGEMERLSKLFTEIGIRTIFLKGPVLAADLYGDLSMRSSADIDLLIPIQDLQQAEDLITKLGYVKDDYILTVLNDWKWRHHHITFFHPQMGMKVEIHWRLNPGPASEPDFNELWENRRVSSLSNYPIYILGSEDLFLFLVSHGSRHGWSRLRWLLDINEMATKAVDWGKIVKLLQKYHCLHVGGQALILASQLLNTPISNEMKVGNRAKELAQDAIFYIRQMVNLHTEPLPQEVSRYHKRHLFSLMSSQQKFLFLFSLLYPYPEDVKTLPLPKTLHFLYFPLRPLLCAWRKARKHALP